MIVVADGGGGSDSNRQWWLMVDWLGWSRGDAGFGGCGDGGRWWL